MKKPVVLLIVCIVLSCFSAAHAANADNIRAPVVLTGCSIWDGKAEKPLGPGEILIRDGKIAEIGKSVSRPEGAEIINLEGHTVTPGFIDAHVHMTFDPENLLGSVMGFSDARKALFTVHSLNEILMNGFTSVRDVAAFDTQYVTVDLRRAIEAGEIIGPRMFVAPHFVTATGAHGDLSGAMAPEYAQGLKAKALADGPEEIQRVVREEIRGGADWVKFGATGGFSSPSDDPGQTTYSQEEMNAIVQTAHDFGVPVCVHAYGAEGIRRSVVAGVDSVEHASLTSPETLALIEKKGIYVVPTQYGFEDMLNNLNNPVYWKNHVPQEYRKAVKYADALRTGQKNLARSNIKVVFGTDTGLFAFRDNWKEFPTMVKNGITPLRAMKAATSMAAEMLRRPDLGVLAAGKTADIVAMPGDPFEDINVTGKVDFVMKEGVIYKNTVNEPAH